MVGLFLFSHGMASFRLLRLAHRPVCSLLQLSSGIVFCRKGRGGHGGDGDLAACCGISKCPTARFGVLDFRLPALLLHGWFWLLPFVPPFCLPPGLPPQGQADVGSFWLSRECECSHTAGELGGGKRARSSDGTSHLFAMATWAGSTKNNQKSSLVHVSSLPLTRMDFVDTWQLAGRGSLLAWPTNRSFFLLLWWSGFFAPDSLFCPPPWVGTCLRWMV